jgi:GntR family transcriptional regulator, transcriptional repressor for pyruvate dehydrogenase complex
MVVKQNKLPKASDILASALRVQILSEGLRAGSPLPSEAELIEQYEFSRGTVREALRLLETDGLVRIRRGPKGGVEVATPDVSHVTRSLATLFAIDETPLRSLVEFRLVIEPASAVMAARDATDEQRELLLRSAEPETQSGFPDSVDFHRLIGAATNNDFMRVILTAIHQVLEWEVTREQLNDAHLDATSHAHKKIAQAISEGNEGKAERLMRGHLLKFRELLEEQGRLDSPIVPRPIRSAQNNHANMVAWT